MDTNTNPMEPVPLYFGDENADLNEMTDDIHNQRLASAMTMARIRKNTMQWCKFLIAISSIYLMMNPFSTAAPIRVVLDLDGTLIYSFPSSNKVKFNVRNPSLGVDIPIGFAPGTTEFSMALSNIPDVKICFFSAGERWRNPIIVKHLMAPNLQWWQPGSYQVLSKEDLDDYKCKDLAKIARNIDLSRTIMVDDMDRVLECQKGNFLKVYPGLTPSTFSSRSGDENEIKSLFRIRSNLVRAFGLILMAIDLSKLTGSTIQQSIYDLQWDSDGNYLHDSTNTPEVYTLGLSEMKKYNPGLSLF